MLIALVCWLELCFPLFSNKIVLFVGLQYKIYRKYTCKIHWTEGHTKLVQSMRYFESKSRGLKMCIFEYLKSRLWCFGNEQFGWHYTVTYKIWICVSIRECQHRTRIEYKYVWRVPELDKPGLSEYRLSDLGSLSANGWIDVIVMSMSSLLIENYRYRSMKYSLFNFRILCNP